MKNDNDLLADMPVWNAFFRLAIPAVAVGAVTNIILDAVLINGIGLGVKGAALARPVTRGTAIVKL